MRALGWSRSSHRLARRAVSGRGTFGRPRYCSPRTPPGTPSWRGPRGGNRGGGGASTCRKPSCPAVRPSRRPSVPLRASSRAAACEGQRDAHAAAFRAAAPSPLPARLGRAAGGSTGPSHPARPEPPRPALTARRSPAPGRGSSSPAPASSTRRRRRPAPG